MKKTNSGRRRGFSSLYSAVRNHAQELVARHDGGPPYDPYLVAEQLDIEVVEELLVGIDGYVEIKDGRYYVGISSSTPAVRKRFTLAHELCHVWLMNQAANGCPAPLIRYRTGKNLPSLHQDPLEESLCNFFASELLIPSEQVESRFAGKTIAPRTIFKLARDYRVSKQTVAIKLTRVFKHQVVACSLWSLKSLWPLPMWWLGVKATKHEMDLLEELVGEGAPTMDLWSDYGKAKNPVVVESARRGDVTVVLIRHRA